MATPKQLRELQESRRYGIGRLLLLARRDFLSRLASRMDVDGDGYQATQARNLLLPYIDVEGTRGVDLARRMGVSKQAVARMVKELEEDGLLCREADSADGRAAIVRFTPYGLQYIMRMHKCIKQIEADYDRMFGHDQMQAVRQTLAGIAYTDQNIQDKDEAGSD